MSLKDVGITDDIHRVACSLNDIFKESFELMTGSLGKHGVFYLPEMKHEYSYQKKPSDEKKIAVFHASNGWMKNPVLRAVKEISSGALRKYKVPLAPNMREVLLVCVGCLEVSAEAVNFCYEATCGGKNTSGTISSGPVIYTLSLELRITQTIRNQWNNNVTPSCNVLIGERSFELSEKSNLRNEVRGLRSLNFLADSIDMWTRDHLNSTVRSQLETKLLVSLDKMFTKHDMCEEFIGQ